MVDAAGQQRRPLTYHAARAMLQRANKALDTNWTLHDFRHTAGQRLLADPAFTPASTNTLVPLLHIVPSKTDAERLIPMSPNWSRCCWRCSAAQRQAWRPGAAVDALRPAREGPRRTAAAPVRPPPGHPAGSACPRPYVRTLLDATGRRAGLTDDGERIRFTPHDFRRLLTTELVGAGLPLHIVAALLGHLSLDTTRGYTAVFPEQVIAAHRSAGSSAAAVAPVRRLRPATGEEWTDRGTFPAAEGRPRRLPPPLRHALRPRARLHPLPVPARGPRPARPHRGDDHQRRRPTRRSPRERLARRGRRPQGEPETLAGAEPKRRTSSRRAPRR